MQVTDMKYAAGVQYLLVVCEDSSAQDLEDLVPDISAAYRSCGDGSLVGVIVALLEGTPSLPPVVPAYVEKF